jgi:hypothetical protein
VRIAPATNSDIKRWSGPAGVSQCLAKSDVLNEALRAISVLDTILGIASPHAVAMDLNLFR